MANDDPYVHEPGNFTIFRERNPEKYKRNPPSHTGSGKITLPDGTDMDFSLACWVKETKKGDRYFSGKIEDKDRDFVPDERPQREDDEDEDIPF